MTPEDIAKTPCRTISEELRERYFRDGACVVERALDASWLKRLNDAVAAKVEESRNETASGSVFDLEPNHTAEEPRLRRLNSPCDHDPVFMELLTDGPLGGIAEDLLGPDVKFYQSKLNFKWSKGGAEVKWHQDQPFFPHTNHAVATFGVYLNDCGPEQGPLRILPSTHEGPIFNHYAEDGSWRGDIRKEDEASLDLESAVDFTAPAGSITVHNYRTVHGSRPNQSALGRPLLLYVLSAADAAPYTAQPLPSRYEQAIVRGKPAEMIHHESGRYRIPPDWSGGYGSIFASQQGEEARTTM